jgi:hypothetical protein
MFSDAIATWHVVLNIGVYRAGEFDRSNDHPFTSMTFGKCSSLRINGVVNTNP